MEIIEVKNLSFQYDTAEVLHDLTFSIEKNTITAILGLSGCGKTTLCHCLAGIIPNCIEGSLTGEIYIDGLELRGKKLSKLASVIGLVMQNPDNQLVTTTVEDELAFGPENMNVPPEEIRIRVDEILELLKLKDLRYENPVRLSGGQKQMVAIASVLALNPDVLILDEPLSRLDAQGKELLISTLKMLRELGKTVIVVEHDYKQMNFADQWLIMERGRLRSLAPSELAPGQIPFTNL